MTSKTFKSALSTDKELRITGGPERVCFAQRAHNGMKSLVFIDNTEAPALALAILEAAGWPEDDPRSATKQIMMWLGDVVRTVERITAEAEAQAKLEAEALDFYNTGCEVVGIKASAAFGDLKLNDKSVFLAVARKAREMRAEK